MGLSRYGGNSTAAAPYDSDKPVLVDISGSGGIVTSVSGTAPISSSGGTTPAISFVGNTVPLALSVATEAELVAAINQCALTIPVFDDPAEKNVITLTAPITLTGPVLIPDTAGMRQTVITDGTLLTASVTSIQSVSGSAGAYTYVLNVDATAGIDEGAIIAIIGGAGSASSVLVNGAAPVESVDSGTRMTVLSENQSATTPALASTALILRICNNPITTDTGGYFILQQFAVLNFGLIAFRSNYAHSIVCGGSNLITSPNAILCWQPGEDGFVTPATSANNKCVMQQYIAGGGLAGLFSRNGQIDYHVSDNVFITGCIGSGYTVNGGGTIVAPAHTHIFGCGEYGIYCADGSRVNAGSASGLEVNYNVITGVFATTGGAVYLSGASAGVSNNGVNFNPATLDTLSADGSLITS